MKKRIARFLIMLARKLDPDVNELLDTTGWMIEDIREYEREH